MRRRRSSTRGGARAIASPIIAGSASDASQDAVVLIMRYEGGKAASLGGCTGTLLTPRLVLTARHCVADTDESSICSSAGEPIQGGRVRGNFPPGAFFVFPGAARPDLLNDGSSRVARGKELVDDGASTLCNHDIALILLDRDLPDAKIAPCVSPRAGLRRWLGRRLATEETREPRRASSGDVCVGQAGRVDEARRRRVHDGRSRLPGGSGGPVFSTGTVVGPRRAATARRRAAESCLDAQNVYTATSGFRELILEAGERAGQRPRVEGEEEGAPSEDDGGCSSSRPGGARDAGPAALVLALAALAARLRRGRTR